MRTQIMVEGLTERQWRRIGTTLMADRDLLPGLPTACVTFVKMVGYSDDPAEVHIEMDLVELTVLLVRLEAIRGETLHNGDYGVTGCPGGLAHIEGKPCAVVGCAWSSKDEYTTGYDSNRVREHVDQAGSEAGTRSAGSRPLEGVRPSGVNERSSGIDGRSGLRTRDRDQRPTGMTEPIKPEHADKIEPVTGTEFSIERRLTGYAYPVNGNVHNPTPAYRWNLLLDGRLVDSDARKSPLIEAARKPGAVALYRESAHKADYGAPDENGPGYPCEGAEYGVCGVGPVHTEACPSFPHGPHGDNMNTRPAGADQ